MKQMAELQALHSLSIVFLNLCCNVMRYCLSNIGIAGKFHFVPISVNSVGLSWWFSFELSSRQTSNACLRTKTVVGGNGARGCNCSRANEMKQ